MKRYSSILLFVCAIVIFVVFRSWFTGAEIIGGDWPYYYDEVVKHFRLIPILWQPWLGNGLGGTQPLLGLHFFGSLVSVFFTQWLRIPWSVAYRIGWFGLFIAVSAYSSWRLTRSPFGILIYLVNSYALMIVSGGQMGVALAYAITPWVLACFIERKQPVVTGLLLAFQMMIDFRIAYITIVGAGMFSLAQLFLPLTIAALLNAFWLLPQVFLRTNPISELGPAYSSVASVKFFSFADFSHTLSLLHPNWPENIFGKTYFLQPEFLIIPVLAFSALLLAKDAKIRFFAFLGVVGAFLAKGANGPFGGLYVWLFERVPGFIMFRDPTKWYVLVVLSYAVLIPYVCNRFSKKFGIIVFLLFLSFWAVLHRQAFMDQLPGTFISRKVPHVYESYKEFIADQPEFFRTLWVPRQSRFTFSDPLHSAMEAEPLFGATNAAELAVALEKEETIDRLAALGIKYVVIPYDSLGELFVSDRKYDEQKRLSYRAVLDNTAWLRKIQDNALTIYETPSHRDLFWTDAGSVSYRKKQYSDFEVTVDTRAEKLYFSQNYHPGWRGAERSPYGLLMFDVPEGKQTVEVHFEPQKYVWWGSGISIATFIVVVGGVIYNKWIRRI